MNRIPRGRVRVAKNVEWDSNGPWTPATRHRIPTNTHEDGMGDHSSAGAFAARLTSFDAADRALGFARTGQLSLVLVAAYEHGALVDQTKHAECPTFANRKSWGQAARASLFSSAQGD